MSTKTLEEESIMTDYQFKSIVRLVTDIAKKSDSLEELVKSLEKLTGDDDKKISQTE